MKTLTFITFILVFVSFSCEKNSDTIKNNFDYMHFNRQGGGQIDFNAYATLNRDQVKILVSEYSFNDTSIQFLIDKDEENEQAFISFHNVLDNKIQITGDFQQSTLLTGTWAYIYFVDENIETEVTNIEIRNSLLEFEQLVRQRIENL